MKKINTFSANSLKILDKSPEEFKNKYLYNLFWMKTDERTKVGQKFHNLICYYLKGFDVSLLIGDLSDDELRSWEKLVEILKEKKDNFIKTEYSFLIKESLLDDFYCLTGRFDAIYKDDEGYIIYDWKTLNLPKNIADDLQSIVYLYCLSKITNSEKIKIRYLSVEKLAFADAEFKNAREYKKRIDDIILKYYKNL